MLDLSVSIVNYESKGDLARCLDSIRAHRPGLDMGVWVVDNASTESIRDLPSRYKEVNFIFENANLGFGAGNNKIIKSVASRYHLILNPDILFISDFLGDIIRYMDADPSIGILGPKLIYEDGRLQYSCRRFPTVASFVARGILSDGRSAILDRYMMRDASHESVIDVDWILGSCILARKDVLDTLGGFDESYFMYYEDIDLCYRIKRMGRRVVYYPLAQVEHRYKRESAVGIFGNKLKYKHTVSAMKFLLKYSLQRKMATFL